jgi:hypothetical protein
MIVRDECHLPPATDRTHNKNKNKKTETETETKTKTKTNITIDGRGNEMNGGAARQN